MKIKTKNIAIAVVVIIVAIILIWLFANYGVEEATTESEDTLAPAITKIGEVKLDGYLTRLDKGCLIMNVTKQYGSPLSNLNSVCLLQEQVDDEVWASFTDSYKQGAPVVAEGTLYYSNCSDTVEQCYTGYQLETKSIRSILI